MSVPSPCIDICRIDAGSGLCAGCFRTLAEISAWSAASADEQRAILAASERRRAGHELPGGSR
ncbi:MAG: DUF1289 domain-containing protein [Rhodocyclaceae bacterium]